VKLSVSPELAAAPRATANRVLFMREPESDRYRGELLDGPVPSSLSAA
jgi:hypothetical protein